MHFPGEHNGSGSNGIIFAYGVFNVHRKDLSTYKPDKPGELYFNYFNFPISKGIT